MNLRRLFWAMLPLALAGFMLTAVACGGDDDDGNGDATGNGAESEDEADDGAGSSGDDDEADDSGDDDEGDEPDTSDDEADDGDDGESGDDGDDDPDSGGGDSGDDGGSGGDGLAFLQQTADALTESTYLVVYQLQAEGLDGSFTFASEPPTTMFALEGEFDGQTGTVMIIADDEFIWFCTDSEGEQGCAKLKGGDAGLIPVAIPTALKADELAQSLLNSPGVQAEAAPGQTIAGIEGECWNVTTEGETVLICVGGGVILLLEGTVDGMDILFEAQEVELDAGEIDIVVPDWPVQDLTSFGD